MGTSMGCMHSFMWGEKWPEAARALMPLACLPVAIAGRNRLWRRMIIDGIEADPAWRAGDYRGEPAQAPEDASDILIIAGSAPRQMQKTMPTPADVDRFMAGTSTKADAGLDANDLIYQVDSSSDYDPSADLEKITAPVMWVNSADDFINPPELGIAEPQSRRMPHGRFVLLPVSDTHPRPRHPHLGGRLEELSRRAAGALLSPQPRPSQPLPRSEGTKGGVSCVLDAGSCRIRTGRRSSPGRSRAAPLAAP